MHSGRYVFSQVVDFVPRYEFDRIVPAPFTFYVMDKAYVDFASFARFDDAGAYFVTRAKDNMRYEVEERNYNIDESCGLILSILHVSAFEKANLKELLSRPETLIQNHDVNEPNLFDY